MRHALTHSNYHVHNGGRSPSFRNTWDRLTIDRYICSDSIEIVEYSSTWYATTFIESKRLEYFDRLVWRRRAESVNVTRWRWNILRWRMGRCNESQLDFGESAFTSWNFLKLNDDENKDSFPFFALLFFCFAGRNIDGHLKEIHSLEILIEKEDSL